MRAYRLIWVLAVCGAGAAGAASARAPSPAALPPFSVQDLVRLARISEPTVSPDGKRVAYALRTTDMDANKGRTALWLLDVRKRNTAAVRLTDLAANSSAPEWSGDGRFLYFLSNRSGSSQVWRLAAGNDRPSEPTQVTNLPLDVSSFRVSPKGDRVFVTMDVYRDCPTLACTKQRLGTDAQSKQHGVLYDHIFVRHWDTWSDGRQSHRGTRRRRAGKALRRSRELRPES
jgi:dipeptidyl aminopeptidase/acylaminoacyl peptidase